MRGLLKNTDYVLIILAVILVVIGILGIYSAGFNSTDNTEYQKQMIWVAVGLVVMGVTWLVDYNLLGKLSYICYGIFVALLVTVLFTTPMPSHVTPSVEAANSKLSLFVLLF